MDTLEWPECKSDKATVFSVVCTVYTGGQPCKPCVLCETGFTFGLRLAYDDRTMPFFLHFRAISAG